MKRFFALLALTVFSLALVSCGEKKDETSTPADDAATEATTAVDDATDSMAMDSMPMDSMPTDSM